MSMIGFEKACADLGISPTKLASVANAATAANVPTATTAVAGSVLKSVAVADDATAVPAAAPAGGTGAAAGGWDTAGNRDLAIATINGLRTDVLALQSKVNALLAALRTAGILTA